MRGTVAQIPEMYWNHLLRNEPSVNELTKEEYEDRMGINTAGGEKKEAPNLGSTVAPHPGVKAVSSLSGRETKAEIIAFLHERGITDTEGRTKKQLLELL